ncbi:autotransporter outer membrane beta-barrel domain-containing protein [Orbus sturtevantii]|uniref:autotransporter outer membrane beta-barrel domain-containing protein n=1 Tax=Orbus sturtevantii TaxID=3074109 RepID=UPI00370D2E0E
MEIKQKHKSFYTVIALSIFTLYSTSSSAAITCNGDPSCPYADNTNQSIVQQGNGSLSIDGQYTTIDGGGLKDFNTASANNHASFIGVGWPSTSPVVVGSVSNYLKVDNLILRVIGSNGADRGIQTFLNDSNIGQTSVTSVNDYVNFNTSTSGSLTTLVKDSIISLATTGQTVSQNSIGINSEAYGSGQAHSVTLNGSELYVTADTQSVTGISAGSGIVDTLIHGSSTATADEISKIGAQFVNITIDQTTIQANSVAASATGIYSSHVQNGGNAQISSDRNSSITVITNSNDNTQEANGILAKTNSLGSNATTIIHLNSDMTVESNNTAGGDAYGIQSHSFSNDIENRGTLTISSVGAKASGIYSSATFYDKTDDRGSGGFKYRYGSDQKITNTGIMNITAETMAIGIDVDGYNGEINIDNSSRVNVTGDNTSTAINVSTGKTWLSSSPFTAQPDSILIRNSGYLITNNANNHSGSGITINAETGVLNGSTITNTGMINAEKVVQASSSTSSDVRLKNSGWLYGNINLTQGGNHIINQFNGIISGVNDSASLVGTPNNVGEITLGTGNAQYIMTGGILNSNLNMGDGTNIGHISGPSKLNSNIKLEGGATQAGDSSKLTLNGQTLTVFTDTANNQKGVNLVNWDNTFLESATITLDGDLFSTAREGDLNINTSSILYSTNPGVSTINGSVVNNGIINLVKTKNQNDMSKSSTLMITGNYAGDPVKRSIGEASIIVNTVWNNDTSTSYSDLVHITGTATGYTEIKTVNGIIGDVTADKVTWKDKYSNDVVVVDNPAAGSNKFYGFANTTGAGMLILVKKDPNTYAWRLPGGSQPIIPIDPNVPGTNLMPLANLNAEYNIIGSLHQRVSEQQTMAWDDCSTCQINHNKGQIWGRLIGNYGEIKGIEKRLEYKSKLWGVQFGYDIRVNNNQDNNSRSHSGVMLSYAKDNLKFYDAHYIGFNTNLGTYYEHRNKTGQGQADIFNLGSYYTYYDKNSSYLDLVGNLIYIRNKYSPIDSSNNHNHGYGIGLSIEVGRPYALTNNGLYNGDWLLEPQAQLIYQYLKYNDMTINIGKDIIVEQQNQQALRGRVGLRLAYNTGTGKLKTQTIYSIANIIHDFKGGKGVKFGSSSLEYPDNVTAGELGLGAQWPLGDTSYVYFDTRYYHTLGGSKETSKKYTGTIGYKYHW